MLPRLGRPVAADRRALPGVRERLHGSDRGRLKQLPTDENWTGMWSFDGRSSDINRPTHVVRMMINFFFTVLQVIVCEYRITASPTSRAHWPIYTLSGKNAPPPKKKKEKEKEKEKEKL